MLTCNCCGRAITRTTHDPDHTYTLPVYDWTPRGLALVGVQTRAVCKPCVDRIMAAHERRIAARNHQARALRMPEKQVRNRPGIDHARIGACAV